MRVKDKTVSLVGLKPEMRIVMKYWEYACEEAKREAVITAGTEAVNKGGILIHSPGSYHPFGYALDFRNRDFQGDEQEIALKFMRFNLGDEYDVILEGNHIHIEYNWK